MFMSNQELIELTGYILPSWQCRWLDSHGWSYTRSRNGRVVVSRAHAELRLSGAGSIKLNFDALKRRA